ncbi:hypothetical protein ANCCAN_12826 [Ancylostoma caninum]|uniref:WD domain, G-beta repeat protein n=1 Tax=Ancylostoma caninum TaxID=29170 RepID=A0A368GDW4_ANCCA|nr:hypothetical protein ANCCAN_12826 [Ancylostoma caninum]
MSEALHLARVFHCFFVVQYVLEKTGRKADMWQDLLVYISKKEEPVDEKLIQEMLTGSVTSIDPRIRMYDVRDKALTCKFHRAQNEHSQIRAPFSPDGKHTVCGSEEKYHIFTTFFRYNGSLTFHWII